MKLVTKIALFISTLFLLNGCDAQTLNDINNALNNFNGTSYGQSYQQRPVIVQPKLNTRCTSTYNAYTQQVYTRCY